ncbi:MAG: septal ring factor EnvC (AmiA/AmiB activator) [Gammaproteobacteria bacterium]|jgi:septal ring factor EnvC (AmiA/AmiB activator)
MEQSARQVNSGKASQGTKIYSMIPVEISRSHLACMRFFSPLLLLLFIVAGLAGFNSATVDAATKNQTERELTKLKTKIRKLKEVIDVKLDSKSQYGSQLKKIESKMANLRQKVRSIDKSIKKTQSELKSLKSTRLKHQKQLSSENSLLAQQVYSAYTLGRQQKLKLLFSQQDAGQLQRNLVYFEYLSNARSSLIGRVEDNIQSIIDTENNIQQKQTGLESQQTNLAQEKQSLDKDQKKRQIIIATLDTQLKKQGKYLDKLKDDAAALQKLITSIGDVLMDAPEPELSQIPFGELRGKLAWPVNGKVRKLFGYQKPLSNLKWQGIIIEAKSGGHVRAVSHGRVAFADWLRGFGYLAIIDHGNTYMSLYGHNEALFKSTGDWVEAGDIIASTGNSGGQSKSGLYFEIRKKGKPQNPTRWCRAENRFTS